MQIQKWGKMASSTMCSQFDESNTNLHHIILHHTPLTALDSKTINRFFSSGQNVYINMEYCGIKACFPRLTLLKLLFYLLYMK